VTDRLKPSPSVPNWLKKSWDTAKRHALDKVSMKEIDAEIAACRRDRRDIVGPIRRSVS